MKYRNTHQKEIIQKVVEGPGKHMLAEEVLLEARKMDSNIGLATVYRNLNLLVNQGIIQKVEGNGFSFYDGNPVPHDHFVCTCCKKIIDASTDDTSDLDRKVEKSLHAKIIKHFITYEGICEDCLKKQEGEKIWS